MSGVARETCVGRRARWRVGVKASTEQPRRRPVDRVRCVIVRAHRRALTVVSMKRENRSHARPRAEDRHRSSGTTWVRVRSRVCTAGTTRVYVQLNARTCKEERGSCVMGARACNSRSYDDTPADTRSPRGGCDAAAGAITADFCQVGACEEAVVEAAGSSTAGKRAGVRWRGRRR